MVGTSNYIAHIACSAAPGWATQAVRWKDTVRLGESCNSSSNELFRQNTPVLEHQNAICRRRIDDASIYGLPP